MALQPKGYLSLYDLAYIHGTTEQEVLRVWVEVLQLEPKERFDYQDLLKVNRILSPVPEPWEVAKRKEDRLTSNHRAKTPP